MSRRSGQQSKGRKARASGAGAQKKRDRQGPRSSKSSSGTRKRPSIGGTIGAAFRAGTDDGFTLTYSRYYPDLMRRTTEQFSVDDPEDVVQSTMLRVWERRDKLRNQRMAPSTYLNMVRFATAHNLEERQRVEEAWLARATSEREEEGAVQQPDDPFVDPRLLTLAAAIDALTSRQRSILALRATYATYAQIAEVLHTTTRNIEAHVRRITHTLRDRVRAATDAAGEPVLRPADIASLLASARETPGSVAPVLPTGLEIVARLTGRAIGSLRQAATDAAATVHESLIRLTTMRTAAVGAHPALVPSQRARRRAGERLYVKAMGCVLSAFEQMDREARQAKKQSLRESQRQQRLLAKSQRAYLTAMWWLVHVVSTAYKEIENDARQLERESFRESAQQALRQHRELARPRRAYKKAMRWLLGVVVGAYKQIDREHEKAERARLREAEEAPDADNRPSARGRRVRARPRAGHPGEGPRVPVGRYPSAVAAFCAGTDDGFAATYARYYPSLLRRATRLLSVDDAEDSVHDVMLSVWKRRRELQGRRLSPQGHLRLLVYRHALNLANRRQMETAWIAQATQERERSPILHSPDDQFIDPRLLTLAAAIDGLTSRQRGILALRVAGASYMQIAELLQTTEKNVEVHLRRLTLRLRDRVRAGGNAGDGPAMPADVASLVPLAIETPGSPLHRLPTGLELVARLTSRSVSSLAQAAFDVADRLSRQPATRVASESPADTALQSAPSASTNPVSTAEAPTHPARSRSPARSSAERAYHKAIGWVVAAYRHIDHEAEHERARALAQQAHRERVELAKAQQAYRTAMTWLVQGVRAAYEEIDREARLERGLRLRESYEHKRRHVGKLATSRRTYRIVMRWFMRVVVGAHRQVDRERKRMERARLRDATWYGMRPQASEAQPIPLASQDEADHAPQAKQSAEETHAFDDPTLRPEIVRALLATEPRPSTRAGCVARARAATTAMRDTKGIAVGFRFVDYFGRRGAWVETTSGERLFWRLIRTRSPARCAVLGTRLAPGTHCWRPASQDGRFREIRLSLRAWPAPVS